MDTRLGTLEVFRNVSVKPGSQQVDKVLLNSSNLLRVQDGAALPAATPAPHGQPAPGKNIWNDDNASTGVAASDSAGDGDDLTENDFTGPNLQANKQGLFALELVDLFNLLVIPPYKTNGDGIWDVDPDLLGQAAAYCEARRAMLVVDPPSSWTNKDTAKTNLENNGVGTVSTNAMVFFPGLIQPNPLQGNQLQTFSPSGAVAGVIARTDAQRGVWKAPAGLEANLTGITRLAVPLTDDENGELNPLAINCLRAFPGAGQVVWGARTLQGDDRQASEWKYIPVRRLALYIEESLYRGTKWAVFEPNDEPLWAQLRLNVGAFMHDLFRQGAFQGQKPQDAYFVACDSSTTTQNDIDNGRVNILVGFAPLKPAEFVILYIQQIAGQINA
jgi:phage tail sheath protein FI